MVPFDIVPSFKQADSVRKLLGETLLSLPTSEVSVSNYGDLKLSVVRVENSKYCERVDCMNLVLIDGLPPLMIMGRRDVTFIRGRGTAQLVFQRRCTEVTVSIMPLRFDMESNVHSSCRRK